MLKSIQMFIVGPEKSREMAPKISHYYQPKSNFYPLSGVPGRINHIGEEHKPHRAPGVYLVINLLCDNILSYFMYPLR